MVKLQEYQSKRLLAKRGVPIPSGEIATSGTMARAVAERLGGPVAVKAQVLVGGRGKAGGIALADTPLDAVREARRLLDSRLKGLAVDAVLIERRVSIERELYVGLLVDRASGRLRLMLSPEGGVEIEEVARQRPQAIHSILVDPLLGLRSYHLTRAAVALGLPRPLWPELRTVIRGLWDTAHELDATLAEINPLVVTPDERLFALDAKMTIDDNALFRHNELAAMGDMEVSSEAERLAREAEISYVSLDGDIGCMVNGAGLAMATMDVVKLYGGEPANFLDIGGGAQADRVLRALEIILAGCRVSAVLINIFGGITRCDEVARGIVAARQETGCPAPMVVRLVGTNEEEGRRILQKADLTTAATLAEAAELTVAHTRGAA